MNFFQRLSYLKKWYSDNSKKFDDHRLKNQKEFELFYSQEENSLKIGLAQLKQKISNDIKSENAMSYDEWVEKYFQSLLKRIAKVCLESDKKELTDDFKHWLNNFSKLDYKLRTVGFERFYKTELTLYDKEIDNYLSELKEKQVFWLYEEDEKFKFWIEHHPLYKELQKLEHLCDNMNDQETAGQNIHLNNSNKKRTTALQKKVIARNMYQLTEADIIADLVRPSVVVDYQASYF